MANYYQVDFKTGQCYQYSKEEKPGYTEFTSKEGNISYRSYAQNGVIGVYQGVSVRDSNFGKQVSIGIKDVDGNMNYLQLPLFDQKKQIATFAEGFIMYLPYLQKDFIYRFFPYNIEPDASKGEKYSKIGLSIKYVMDDFLTINAGYQIDRMTPSYTKKTGEKVVGMVPEAFWTKAVDNTNQLDRAAKDRFLYDTLMKHSQEKVGGGSSMKVEANGPAPTAVTGAASTVPATPAASTAAPTSTPASNEPMTVYTQGDPVVPQAAPAPAQQAPAPQAPAPTQQATASAIQPNAGFDKASAPAPVPTTAPGVSVNTAPAPVTMAGADTDDLPF